MLYVAVFAQTMGRWEPNPALGHPRSSVLLFPEVIFHPISKCIFAFQGWAVFSTKISCKRKLDLHSKTGRKSTSSF